MRRVDAQSPAQAVPDRTRAPRLADLPQAERELILELLKAAGNARERQLQAA